MNLKAHKIVNLSVLATLQGRAQFLLGFLYFFFVAEKGGFASSSLEPPAAPVVSALKRTQTVRGFPSNDLHEGLWTSASTQGSGIRHATTVRWF